MAGVLKLFNITVVTPVPTVAVGVVPDVGAVLLALWYISYPLPGAGEAAVQLICALVVVTGVAVRAVGAMQDGCASIIKLSIYTSKSAAPLDAPSTALKANVTVCPAYADNALMSV